MTNPYRALCAEVLTLLDLYEDGKRVDWDVWRARARALLAEPEAEGPTDEELLRVAATAIEPYERYGIAPGEYEPETGCAVEASGSELIAFARAVLARWGRPAAAPVPVSERPWERQGWCDKDGRCWFGWADEPDASWSFCKPSERDTATVSLPANALPLPAPEETK